MDGAYSVSSANSMHSNSLLSTVPQNDSDCLQALCRRLANNAEVDISQLIRATLPDDASDAARSEMESQMRHLRDEAELFLQRSVQQFILPHLKLVTNHMIINSQSLLSSQDYMGFGVSSRPSSSNTSRSSMFSLNVAHHQRNSRGSLLDSNSGSIHVHPGHQASRSNLMDSSLAGPMGGNHVGRQASRGSLVGSQMGAANQPVGKQASRSSVVDAPCSADMVHVALHAQIQSHMNSVLGPMDHGALSGPGAMGGEHSSVELGERLGPHAGLDNGSGTGLLKFGQQQLSSDPVMHNNDPWLLGLKHDGKSGMLGFDDVGPDAWMGNLYTLEEVPNIGAGTMSGENANSKMKTFDQVQREEYARSPSDSVSLLMDSTGNLGNAHYYSGMHDNVSGIQAMQKPNFFLTADGMHQSGALDLNEGQNQNAMFQRLQAMQLMRQQQNQEHQNQQLQQQLQQQQQQQMLLVQQHQQQQQMRPRPSRASTMPTSLMQRIAAGGNMPGNTMNTSIHGDSGGALSVFDPQRTGLLLDGLPTRFRVLPLTIQKAIWQLTCSSPALVLKDFDDKVVSKIALMSNSFGQEECLKMMNNLMGRIRMKQGAMKNGPGYLDVAVSSHLDMLKFRDLFPSSGNMMEYAKQALCDNVFKAMCVAVETNQWLAWEHLDQGIIQLLRKLTVESALEKLQEISMHSFKNVDNVRGCLMSMLNSRLREDRRIASANTSGKPAAQAPPSQVPAGQVPPASTGTKARCGTQS